MAQAIKATLTTVKCMDMAVTHVQMVASTQATSIKIKWKVMELYSGPMEDLTMVNSLMINLMVQEYSRGPMVVNLMGNGTQESNMEKASTNPRTVRSVLAFGNMEISRCGFINHRCKQF